MPTYASPECRLVADILEGHGFATFSTRLDRPAIADAELTDALVREFLDRNSETTSDLRDASKNATEEELIEAVLPGSYDRIYRGVTVDTAPDDPARAEANLNWSVLRSLVWGNYCRVDAVGKVQEQLITKGFLLIEAPVYREDSRGHLTTTKGRFSTRNQDWIEEHFVDVVLDKWMKSGKKLRSNLKGAIEAIPEMEDRVRLRAGVKLDNELANMVTVARPSLESAAARLGLQVSPAPALESGDAAEE
jgi:hypothetical protein